ncbi:MAG: iron-containing alcohol dehydrogenase [Caldilineaceae bacterium]|nr:iron-containing alcohol dehydrogenase [Caldilineaceae bacterium]
MWYFAAPREIVFGEEALSHIEFVGGSRAFIVTDAVLQQLGIVDRIVGLFQAAGMETEVFAEVEPEPSLQTARRGGELARAFAPDWVVGLGGGSPMDAAKAIYVLCQRPELDPTDINPMETLGLEDVKLMAIPTTSGTGSEATFALVLTDTEEQRKYSTGNREVVPHVAIIDPELTMKLPPRITADTGLDALTHAIEGYTATWHNVFTDGLCLQAAKLVFEYLPRAYADGANDVEAREQMGNAATIAGLGFSNSLLALAHAMGHSAGALFKQPHGRTVALFLPYTMEFTVNGGGARYADIARFVGLTDSHDEGEAGRILVEAVRGLERTVAQPMSLAELGVDRAEFQAKLDQLCAYAEMDTQFFTAPRIPDDDELRRLFEYAYAGKAIDF